jgi:hypothetical protein
MNSSAAPPIDAPAMPPGLSFADEEDDEMAEDVALVLVVDEVVEVVEELDVDEVAVEDCVFEAAELTTPLGVRSW